MNLSKGRVIFASRNSYTVLCGDIEYYSVLSGSLRREGEIMPAVGDHVEFYANENGDSVIESIQKRKSVISRKSSGRGYSESVLAANVDVMLIVTALDSTFSRRRIERFLVLAESGGARPVIVLSKADAADPINLAVCVTEAEDAGGCAEVIEASAVTGAGLERLKEILGPGVTACAVGLSGAGKSTLLNRLAGSDITRTGEVRKDDSKGKHTTTARHMFRLPSGAMFIDTPGLREVGLTGDMDAVEEVFGEITEAGEDCWYSDCSHVHEPGCAVLEAVANGEISRDRYDSYMKLRAETENYKMRTEDPQRKKKADKSLSKLVRSVSKRKKRF